MRVLFQRALKNCELPKYTIHNFQRTFAGINATILKRPTELKALMQQRKIDTAFLRYYVEIDILEIGKKFKS